MDFVSQKKTFLICEENSVDLIDISELVVKYPLKYIVTFLKMTDT